MPFDLALIETDNGGDLQLVGNDLAVINSIENQVYLALFGGNKESTVNPSASSAQNAQSFDCWMNNLLMPSNQSQQFNSLCENLINSTALTSQGRIIIENGIKKDLQYLQPQATITVSVIIVSTDQININITIKENQQTQVTIIKFKKAVTGDFSVFDFNSDFFT